MIFRKYMNHKQMSSILKLRNYEISSFVVYFCEKCKRPMFPDSFNKFYFDNHTLFARKKCNHCWHTSKIKVALGMLIYGTYNE